MDLPLLSRGRVSLLFVLLASAGSAYALACGSGSDSGFSDATEGDGGPGALPDAAVVPSDAGQPATTIRLAHVAADLGPVDFCYRMATTTSFEGPVLGGGLGGVAGDAGDAGDAASDTGTIDAGDDAGDGGLPPASVGYRTATRYLKLDAAGPLTIALVEPGATSCASPIFVQDVTLDPGKLSTVAIVGRQSGDAGGSALALVGFTDDRTTTPNKARVRMIHAALGLAGGRSASGPLAVRAAASQTEIVAERVEPKKAASPSASVPVDSLGYASIQPLPSPAMLAVGAAAGAIPVQDASIDSWVSTAAELGLTGGSLHTGFVLTGDAQPFEVLWCTDTSTTDDRTTCSVVR